MFDTFNESAVKQIMDNTMKQFNVNRHILTGIVTVYNLLNQSL